MRSYSVTTASTIQIISTAEAKVHLKVDTTVEDSYIDDLIAAATDSAQEYTNRFFMATKLKQVADTWNGISELFKSQVSSVTTISYYDSDGGLTEWDDTNYLIDTSSMPARVTLVPDGTLPDIQDRVNAVIVDYTVGVTTAAEVPQAIKQAILLMIGNYYANRSEVVVGSQVNEMPLSAQYLLNQYRVQVIR